MIVLASVVLALAALADGISTVRMLKNPENTETNPIFGKRPSTARVFGEGGAIIATEIALAACVRNVHPAIEIVIGLFMLQAAFHVFASVHNSKL